MDAFAERHDGLSRVENDAAMEAVARDFCESFDAQQMAPTEGGSRLVSVSTDTPVRLAARPESARYSFGDFTNRASRLVLHAGKS